MDTNDTRFTDKMALFDTHNLGMTENTRLEATPSIMEGVYENTIPGKQSKQELGVSPLPFNKANELNTKDKLLNDARILKRLENKTKPTKRTKLLFGLILILIFFLICVILFFNIGNNDEDDEIEIEIENEGEDEVFRTTDPTEIREICEALGNNVVEDDSDVNTSPQFIVCTDENVFLVCEKNEEGDLELRQNECRNEGNSNNICPCIFGDFVDLRREQNLNENDICVEQSIASNSECNILLDNDPNIDLESLLLDQNKLT